MLKIKKVIETDVVYPKNIRRKSKICTEINENECMLDDEYFDFDCGEIECEDCYFCYSVFNQLNKK